MVTDTTIAGRQAYAAELHRQGYNCAQCVAMAVADLTGIAEDTLAACTGGLGGGIGRSGDVCGVITGMAVAAGAAGWREPADRNNVYDCAGELYSRFSNTFGATSCRALKGELRIPCPRLIAEGVKMATEALQVNKA